MLSQFQMTEKLSIPEAVIQRETDKRITREKKMERQ